MKVSFVIPTRDRPEVLHETLRRLGALRARDLPERCELIVVDNASRDPVEVPDALPHGMPIRLIRLEENLNTAARNIAAQSSDAEWLVMLDDDSSPIDGTEWALLDRVDEKVGAIGGEIYLPSGAHESGGLPEVVVGCGCAIRREFFVELGGYDETFGYYVEEYDLCARMIQAGYRVEHSRSLRFLHRKSDVGRDFNNIIYRLVRNNAWVMQRYAPEAVLEEEVRHLRERYRAIAINEDAMDGYTKGIEELERTLKSLQRIPMQREQWDRFTGRSAARKSLDRIEAGATRAEIIGPERAKGREIIESELVRAGYQIVRDGGDVSIIGTLSPGPMLDLQDQFPDAIAPWALQEPARIHPSVLP